MLLMVGTVSPAFAAKRVTVEQFSQWVVGEQGKPDKKIAGQIPGMELTERASTGDLARWEAALPGPQTRDALIALTDESRFLAPAAAEIPQRPAPGSAAQQAMLLRAVEYVSKTLTKLPNFSATRETMHFEDRPPLGLVEQAAGVQTFAQGRGSATSASTSRYLPAEPIHLVTQSSVVVTYRDGLEVGDTGNQKIAKTQATEGFTTSGEFGPVLSVVLGDAIRSDVRWGYWEGTPQSPRPFFFTRCRRNIRTLR